MSIYCYLHYNFLTGLTTFWFFLKRLLHINQYKNKFYKGSPIQCVSGTQSNAAVIIIRNIKKQYRKAFVWKCHLFKLCESSVSNPGYSVDIGDQNSVEFEFLNNALLMKYSYSQR